MALDTSLYRKNPLPHTIQPAGAITINQMMLGVFMPQVTGPEYRRSIHVHQTGKPHLQSLADTEQEPGWAFRTILTPIKPTMVGYVCLPSI